MTTAKSGRIIIYFCSVQGSLISNILLLLLLLSLNALNVEFCRFCKQKRPQISDDDVSLRLNKSTRFTKAYNNCCYYVSVDFWHFDHRIFDPKPRVDCTQQYWQNSMSQLYNNILYSAKLYYTAWTLPNDQNNEWLNVMT